MKSIRLNIRALAFDGATSLPSSGQINYNSKADAHELTGSGGNPLGKFGVLRMKDLIAREVISATDHAYVSRVGHSGQAGVTSFVVRSCHVGLKRQVSTSPTRETDPSTGASQVGPFTLGPTDELVLTSNGSGEQSVTLALLVGTALEVERLIDRNPPEIEDLALHAEMHRSGGADPIKLDDLAAPDDNTDLDASTTRHGLLRKLSNVAAEYLDGTGAWSSLTTGITATKLDDLATPDDNTDLNASTTRHGLLRKLSNVATEYLDGTGAWSSPTLEAVLVAGQVTDGKNIIISNGDSVVGADGGSISFAAATGLLQLSAARVPSLLVASADAGDAPAGADELVIGDGSASFGQTIFTGAASIGALVFTDVANTLRGAVRYDHATDRLHFDAAGVERAFISSTGIDPAAAATYDIGSVNRWRDGWLSRALYVAGGVTGHAAEAADLSVGSGGLAAGSTFYSTAAAAIYFADTVGGSQGGLFYLHASDRLTLRAGSSDRVNIDTAVYPNSHNAVDLGKIGQLWRSIMAATDVITPLLHGADFGVGSGGGDPLSVHGGDGGTTGGAGAALALRGGNAQASNANGGPASLLGGAPSGSGTPGAIAITAAAAVSGNVIGAAVTSTAGAGSGTQAGGAVSSTAGQGGATGIGGAAAVTAGAGGATSGAGGPASITGGAGTNGNAAGGAATCAGGPGQGSAAGGAASVTGGLAGATGIGGAAAMTGGAGGATSGAGGPATMTGGAGTAGNAVGGVSTCTGGAGQGSAAGGVASTIGGTGGATGAGGKGRVVGGAGGVTSGTGGAAEVTGGAGTASTATGGAASVTGGAGGGTGGAASLTSGAGLNSGAVSIASGAVTPGGGGTRGTITIDAPTIVLTATTDITVTHHSYHGVRGSTVRGSTNTLIYRWTGVAESGGSDISYTNSATAGGSWAINTAGIYAVSCSIDVGHNGYVAIKKNNGLSNTFDEVSIMVAAEAIAGRTVALSWTGLCAAGDDIWISTSVATDPTGTPANNNRVSVYRVR